MKIFNFKKAECLFLGDRSLGYNGHVLTFDRGEYLNSFDGIAYKYDRRGRRVEKTIDGVTHKYEYHGKRLISETWEDNVLVPIYDGDNEICGIVYNREQFYFVKDIQGSIILIADSRGEVVARYAYSEHGEIVEAEDVSDVGIGYINPFYFRGRYYDSETGLYYFDGRYYDPENDSYLDFSC